MTMKNFVEIEQEITVSDSKIFQIDWNLNLIYDEIFTNFFPSVEKCQSDLVGTID